MPQSVANKTNKVLLFEFITGGGFAQQPLPSSLAKEGVMMLQALINELALCPGIELTVVLDWRIKEIQLPDNTTVVNVLKNQCVYQLLPDLINKSGFVWPIAPEIDGALYKVTKLIEKTKAQLLNSCSQAIYLCSDKFATIQSLNLLGIASVETQSLDLFSGEFEIPWVIKPKEGAGCLDTYYIAHENEFVLVKKQINCLKDYSIQPFIKGATLSLSCLFRKGEAWLLSCNQQQMSIENGQFELEACIVNIESDRINEYQALINKIAIAIPGLSSYVGIDIIQPDHGIPQVLEINPRLTTSYVGIQAATGLNIAKAVIEMSETAPILNKTRNQQYKVSINE